MKNILYTLALLVCFNSFGQTAEEYYSNAWEKFDNEDYYGAIADFSKSIELDPNDSDAYSSRAWATLMLTSNTDANDPKILEAIKDYDKSIELDPDNSDSYFRRGMAKYRSIGISDACPDLKKALSLGSSDAAKLVSEFCN